MSSTSANFWLTLLVLSILSTATTTGQFLEAEYLNVKLPYPNNCPTPHYDGEDSIYLFGGCSPESWTDILKFSISSETLQKVGSFPRSVYLGTTQSDNFGNIFYFGGGSGSEVYQFNPATNTTTSVAVLPYTVHGHISIKPSETSNTVFILGAWDQGRELLSFDMATLTSSIVPTSLPFFVYTGTSVRVGNKAYIFDDDSPNGNQMALELDLDTLYMQPIGPSTLPIFAYYPSSVWDGGKYVYLIGGFYTSTGHSTGGLIRFDLSTHENDFLAVRNFPVEGPDHYFYAPASIFVPRNTRIYFFGGRTINGTTHIGTARDEIFYIDMPPADLFTCTGRPNGVYPHPTDCSLFMGCHDEELTVFSCPPPLLFDTVGLRCDYPDAVTCST